MFVFSRKVKALTPLAHILALADGWVGNQLLKKKEQKHFPTFTLLSPFDLPAHKGEVKNSAGAFEVLAPWLINIPT
jgi:hypothetical protein